MIIAVDGPAASGKGTIARALARRFGLPHLDTGLLYRAVGTGVIRAGGNPANEHDALAACAFEDALLASGELRGESAGRAASVVSAHPAVRAELFERQRRFAARTGGAVLDGRDIGTVIAPDADAKLFVTASTQARARRRHAELATLGLDTPLDVVLAEISARDERDASRAAAPLRRAEDAILLDTSTLDIAAAVAAAIALVEERTRRQVIEPSP